MHIAFVGGGVMAEAIIAGILDAKLGASVAVGEPVEARRRSLAEMYGITVTGSNREALDGADMAVLAIKPQQFEEVAGEIKDCLRPEQTIASIMAGVKVHSIGLKLNHHRIIRIMPNTPAQVRQGMSVWTATPDVPDSAAEFTKKMLAALGDEVQFSEEKYVDIATALSASGPGYVFAFLESLIDGAVQLGMPYHLARRLATQTLLGSAALAKKVGVHPAELKNRVTSPGGTTAAGLFALEKGGFSAATIEAVLAAYARGEELGASGK